MKVILEGDGRTVGRIIKENRVRVGRGLVKFSPAEDAAIVEDTKDVPVEDDDKDVSAEDTKDIPSEDAKEAPVADEKKPKTKK